MLYTLHMYISCIDLHHSTQSLNHHTIYYLTILSSEVMQHDKICAITCWNVDGLRNKLLDDSFHEKLRRYDIVGLVETWTTDEKDCTDLVSSLDEFNYVFVPATGKCLAGRKSSGIILLYRKSLNSAIKLVSKTSNTI